MAGNADPARALMDRAIADGDPQLAEDIERFARSREYGLVFEHNRPEAMRLYGKPINVGDIVHILPDRGEKESVENRVEWRVLDVDGDKASLEQVDDACVTCEVIVDDVVAVAEYDQPIYAGLRETGRVERDGGTLGDPGDKPYHVVINGENYHALEALEFCYAGKVDCVYIDPPYNTGAKDWKYNNDYVGADDAYRHSKWLAWMERRLKLAKTLLNPDDSVLVCTIDEKEYLRLGLLLEQTFPDSRIQMISSVINPKGVAGQSGFRRADEYIFFVMMGHSTPIALPLGNEWSPSAIRSNTSSVPKRKTKKQQEPGWTSMMRRGSHSSREERPGLYYAIYADPEEHRIAHVGDVLPSNLSRDVDIDGLVQVLPIRTNGSQGCWQVGPEECRSRIEQGRIRLGRGTSYGFVVNYLPDGEYAKILSGDFELIGRAKDGSIIAHRKDGAAVDKWVAPTQWKLASHDASAYGSSLLMSMICGKRFPFPKSLYAVEDTLRFFIGGKPDAIVLDFFAGSGTTAHAVMRLNHQDGGRRISISVTNNEVSAAEERELTAAGLRHGDADWEKHGICRHVTIPRVRAAITGRTPQNQPIKGDYRFTDPFPMADGFAENAVFFDLTYQDPYQVELRRGFQAISPLLWMRAGCRGPIIRKENDTYAIADTYAVLFRWSAVNAFIKRLEEQPEARTVYVVTDDPTQYTRLCGMLPDRDVIRLYRSYLESFKIASEGAVD